MMTRSAHVARRHGVSLGALFLAAVCVWVPTADAHKTSAPINYAALAKSISLREHRVEREITKQTAAYRSATHSDQRLGAQLHLCRAQGYLEADGYVERRIRKFRRQRVQPFPYRRFVAELDRQFDRYYRGTKQPIDIYDCRFQRRTARGTEYASWGRRIRDIGEKHGVFFPRARSSAATASSPALQRVETVKRVRRFPCNAYRRATAAQTLEATRELDARSTSDPAEFSDQDIVITAIHDGRLASLKDAAAIIAGQGCSRRFNYTKAYRAIAARFLVGKRAFYHYRNLGYSHRYAAFYGIGQMKGYNFALDELETDAKYVAKVKLREVSHQLPAGY